MLFIRQMVDNDLVVLSKSITEGDLEELRVFDKEITVIDALKWASSDCKCYSISDEFGVVYATGGVNISGVAWFITSDSVELLTYSEVKVFINLLREHRDSCLMEVPYLTNYISSYNTKHIKLLKLLGATFGKTMFKQIQTFVIKGGQ